LTATIRVMSPEEIASRAGGQAPYLQWPVRSTVFAERAMRLRQLASGHAMKDFLSFMADLALAQQAQLLRHPSVAVPGAGMVDEAARHGLPPLSAEDWTRDPAWLGILRSLIADLRPAASGTLAETLDRLTGLDDATLELQADALLSGSMTGLDLAASPFVAAALQVHWVHLALAVGQGRSGDAAPFARLDDATVCPCCGSRPTASVVRMDAAAQGQRYLHCSLCQVQWNLPRITCTHCGGTKGVAYQSLQNAGADETEGARAASVQAETCDDCGHYLKIMHAERDPQVDPVADDLATLTLDLLVSETGLRRHGVNLMLLFGDPDPGDPPDPGGT